MLLGHAYLSNEAGPAMAADDVTIGGELMGNELIAIGKDDLGAIRLIGGRLGGALLLQGARISNPIGPALNAEGLAIDNSAVLDESFTASGKGSYGTVRLAGGRIDGQLILRGSLIVNTSGPAFNGYDLTIGSDAVFDRGFTAVGRGDLGTIRLLSGRIGGQISLSDASLSNLTGPALVADRLVVESNAYVGKGFKAVGSGERYTVRLNSVSIKGGLSIDASEIASLTSVSHRLLVNGLTYQRLYQTSWTDWLHILKSSTPEYAPQPYRQLASTTSAAGHDSDTKQILIAQRADQLDRAGLKPRDRLWGHFTWFTLGYGYQPWRALIGLLAVTAIITLMMAGPLGADGLSVKDDPDKNCALSDRIVLGIDTGVPLVTANISASCLPRANAAGRILSASSLTAQIAGWAFATLFVAGFTSAVRKT